MIAIEDTAAIKDYEKQNIINSKSAGLSVDVVFIPCRKRTPEQEISLILKSVGASTVSRFWIGVSSDETDCSWSSYPP